MKTDRHFSGAHHFLRRRSLAGALLFILFLGFTPCAFAQGGTWTTKGPLPVATGGAKGAVANGTFYVLAGKFPHVAEQASFWAYDSAVDTWAAKPTEPIPRSEQAVGVVNGILYDVGGWDGNTLYNTNHAFDPGTNTWTTKASMPTARRSAAAGVVAGILYVVGGHIPFVGNIAHVEAYDPASDTWSAKAPMPTGRNFLGVGVVNGIIYAVGGLDNNNQIVGTVEAYDPTTNTWTTKALMPTPRAVLGVAVINGILYAVGGATPTGFVSTVEAYDPTTDTWSSVSSMPTARQQPAVGVVNGILHVVGGANPAPLATNEAFHPSAFPAPGGALSALASDGTFLYVGFASSPCEIFKLDPTTGAVQGTLPTPTCQPRGMVFDGAGHFFLTNLGDFGAGSVFEIDAAGTVLNSFPVPFRAHAIAFDGANLYIGDTDSGQIRVTDRSGNHIRTFDSGLRPAGLVYDPSTAHLWVITMFDRKIYEITTGGQMVRSCDGPRHPGVQGLGGLTMVGRTLYIGQADPSPFTPPFEPAIIFIVNPRSLTCNPPIPVNLPPVANAGADQTVECNSPTGTSVTLDGSASSDPDAGDTLSYEWRDAANNLVGSTPTVALTLPLGTHTFTLTVNDGKGGMGSDTVLVTVQDTTPPNLALSTSNITVVVPTASATGATVDLTGVATATDACDPMVTISHNAPALFPIGSTTVTFTATDDSGNASTAQLTVHVVYNFGGFQMPIRSDGSSVFRSGRLIPIRFPLTAADGTFITNATATLAVFKVTDQVTGTVEEITPDAAGSSNTGNLFRFDPDANQYIYNLSTAGYTAGTYLLRVSLNDATTHEVQVSVK